MSGTATSTWYNYTWTWQKSGTSVVETLYVNGVLIAPFTGTYTAPGTTVYLGGSNGNTPSIGVYGEMAIYNAALNATQVKDVYDHGISVPEPVTAGLLALGGAFLVARRRRRTA